MTIRVDTVSLIAGATVCGVRGLGVLGSAIPASGDAGASLLFNDITLPGEATDEFRVLILSAPAGGNLFAYEDGSFTATGYADGTHSGTYEGFKNGVSYGTATFNIVVGAGVTMVQFTPLLLMLTA